MKKLSEKRVYNGYLKIDEAVFKTPSGEEVTRQKLVRPDAVACLILNGETNQVILVQQHRYPIAAREQENILEAVAGKIDGNEDPRDAIKREILEEVGFEVQDRNLSQSIETYSSAGYSSEKVYLFAAMVTNADRKTEGGGVSSEHEHISIVHMDRTDFENKIHTNEIKDAHTILCANLMPR